jgi:hypothetical protein
MKLKFRSTNYTCEFQQFGPVEFSRKSKELKVQKQPLDDNSLGKNRHKALYN